jgi:hypothetical protein
LFRGCYGPAWPKPVRPIMRQAQIAAVDRGASLDAPRHFSLQRGAQSRII